MFYYVVEILPIKVKLQLTYHSSLAYEIGDIVRIEVKNHLQWAIITDQVKQPQHFATKPIMYQFACLPEYKIFLKQVADYYVVDYYSIIKKITNQYCDHTKNDLHEIAADTSCKKTTLNDYQQKIARYIENTLSHEPEKPFVLHGVTGCGKTVLYKNLIDTYYQQNKSVLYLCPTIHLCQEIEKMLSFERGYTIFTYHSQSPKKIKKMAWDHITLDAPIIVIGVHMPIWMPLKNIGLIIIDEEHDTQYSNQNSPYWNTREIALIRAKVEKIPLILGSATPSIQSLFNVENKRYNYIYCDKKYHDTKPPVLTPIILDTNDKKNYLSRYAKERLAQEIQQNKQILIYLNKKGLYRYARCKKCLHVFMCLSCSIAMTIYDHHIGVCSRCETKIIIPTQCPSCHISYSIECKGVGIERIKKDLELEYPDKKIMVMQGNKKQKSEGISEKLHGADIIIGTDIITQGYNFYHLTLVIVVNADQNFSIPHYLIFEETIQTIIQIIGRVNRFHTNGEVIIQSYNDLREYIPFMNERKYRAFVTHELRCRELFKTPPYWRQSILIIKGKDEQQTEEVAKKIYRTFMAIQVSDKTYTDVIIHEPTQGIIKKIKKNYYWQIIIKNKQYPPISSLIKKILSLYSKEKNYTIHFIPNHIHTAYE